MFWPTVVSFPAAWDAPAHEHGWIVVGFVAWLLWRDHHALLAEESEGILDLVPVITALSLAWLIAVIAGIGSVHEALMPAIVALWAIATLGWVAGRLVVPITAMFMLAVPLWTVANPVLQRLTTIVSGAVTRLVGIEAEVGFDTITLSAGTFLVEAGCSGLNYLMGALVLSSMYAQLFIHRWQTQVKVIAVAAAASIFGNWLRVTMLIIIGELSAMQSGMLEDHLWQGWWIFTLLMIPTYFVARKIERRDAARYGKAPRRVKHPLSGRAARARDRRAVLAGLAAIVGPAVYMGVGAIPRGGSVDRSVATLQIAPAWSVEEKPGEELSWVPSYRGVDERAAWTLRSEGQVVEAARHYFRDQRFGEELIQFANALAPDSLMYADRMVGPVGQANRLVREAIVFDDRETARVVWYWYRVGGFDTAVSMKAKLLEIVSFVRRTPAAELITVTAPCVEDDCGDAARAIRSAMGMAMPSTGPARADSARGDPSDS